VTVLSGVDEDLCVFGLCVLTAFGLVMKEEKHVVAKSGELLWQTSGTRLTYFGQVHYNYCPL